MVYRFIRPVLYLLPAEVAHELGFWALRVCFGLPWLRRVVQTLLTPTNDALEVRVMGLTFPTPVGLAAGFDKNAVGYRALHALGFGHVEVGTVTAQPQPGNPKPRLFRLTDDRALLNRLGFNNLGSKAAAERLREARSGVVGVNIGKSKVTAETEAAADYAKSARRLGEHADYLVINVSSPNTPGLRSLQTADKLRPILQSVQRELSAFERAVPLLVKIAPDLSEDEILAIADLALDMKLDGIIATNTTVERRGLRTSPQTVEALGAGGVSGAPLKDRSLQVLRLLRSRVGDRLVLISVGGVCEPDDAWERIKAGASLLQLYTAFVYEGPLLPRRLAKALLLRAQREGFETVQAAVGSEISQSTPS